MKFRIDDFPPNMQAQIRAKLAADAMGKNSVLPSVQCGEKANNAVNEVKHGKKRGEANQTERRFEQQFLQNTPRVYEGITFRLPGGSRYTPDWVWWVGGQMYAVEVKGNYRHHSHGRARTAFKECVAAYPRVIFWWATWTGSTWKILRDGD